MRTCKCLEKSRALIVIFIAFLETSRFGIHAVKSSVQENTFWDHAAKQDSTTLDTTKEDTRVDEPTEPTSTQTVTQESIYHQEVDFFAIREDEQTGNKAVTKRESAGNRNLMEDDGHKILRIIQNFLTNHSHNQEAAYEEVMEMMAIVAANPEQWHRIKEIWEQHARHANSKSTKDGQQKTEKVPIKANKSPHPKLPEKAIEEENSVMMKGVTAIPDNSPRRKGQRKPRPKGKPKEPQLNESFQGKNILHHHHHHNGKPKGDFAIERPVTVIGERSQVDPVEQELIEAAANRRFKTLEQVKQGVRTNEEEENVEQLHTLSKMKSRLKQHKLQKDKLRRKLKEQNQQSMD